jgi:hypothetical protein
MDPVLLGTLTGERFQPVDRRHPEIFQPPRDLQLPRLAVRDRLDTREPPDPVQRRMPARPSLPLVTPALAALWEQRCLAQEGQGICPLSPPRQGAPRRWDTDR